MKKFLTIALIISALLSCGSYNSQNMGIDRGGSAPEDIPPSFAHPGGETMRTKP